jgi:hypothetical protein
VNRAATVVAVTAVSSRASVPIMARYAGGVGVHDGVLQVIGTGGDWFLLRNDGKNRVTDKSAAEAVLEL